MAVGDYFLKIDGIDGEAQDLKHKGEIQLESFHWSESRQTRGPGGGGGAGSVNMGDFGVSMRTNKASLPLLLAVATGQHLKWAVLTAARAGKDLQTYLTYKFSDLVVSTYQTETPEDQGLPIDQVSFSFGQIDVEYRPQLPDGTVGSAIHVGWDTRANRPT